MTDVDGLHGSFLATDKTANDCSPSPRRTAPRKTQVSPSWRWQTSRWALAQWLRRMAPLPRDHANDSWQRLSKRHHGHHRRKIRNRHVQKHEHAKRRNARSLCRRATRHHHESRRRIRLPRRRLHRQL